MHKFCRNPAKCIISRIIRNGKFMKIGSMLDIKSFPFRCWWTVKNDKTIKTAQDQWVLGVQPQILPMRPAHHLDSSSLSCGIIQGFLLGRPSLIHLVQAFCFLKPAYLVSWWKSTQCYKQINMQNLLHNEENLHIHFNY